MDDRYAVVQVGRKFRVYHESDARAVGGVIFPPADGLTGYQRARKAALDWEEELRALRSKASSG